MPDRQINCKDCRQDFNFSEGEQDFYDKKGFSDPVRCPDCRKKRKAGKNNGGGRRNNFSNWE